ncbi:hypothetical protein [Nocardia sp. R6R-6]|uniref:hypothetical protein n=1 Tax=Nocardia sp. R6R-6 TaxID=3459303 RepID=UPI00403D6900
MTNLYGCRTTYIVWAGNFQFGTIEAERLADDCAGDFRGANGADVKRIGRSQYPFDTQQRGEAMGYIATIMTMSRRLTRA